MGCFPGMRTMEARHAGKIEADGRCRGTGGVARLVEIGAARRGGPGAGDPADPGRAALRRRKAPGRQAEIGPHAGAIATAILNEDTRHDGGWTLGRLCAEIARRGGPAISPAWLSHQLWLSHRLRQRGLPSGGRATPSNGARTKRRLRPAASVSSI